MNHTKKINLLPCLRKIINGVSFLLGLVSMLIAFTGICFAAPQAHHLEQFLLKKEGKAYPIHSISERKMSLVRIGMKIFLLNSAGERIFLGKLGTGEKSEKYQPMGAEDVLVGNITCDGNTYFFLKTIEGTGGASYYIVDSKGEDISKKIFSGMIPIIQTPDFNYDKKELSFFLHYFIRFAFRI